jgi:exopolysaccharide biosynthesis polyprenyl glycosylphosphotransferase
VTWRFIPSLEDSPRVAALDLLVLHACAYAAIFLAARAERAGNLQIYAHILPLLSIAAVVSFSVCGLYRSWSRRAAQDLVSALFLAECLYITIWMSLGGWEPRWAISRGAIAAAAALQLPLLAAERMFLRRMVWSEEKQESGVIVAEDLGHAHAVREKLSSASPSWLLLSACLTAEEFEWLPEREIPWGTVLVTQDVKDKIPAIRKASQLRKSVYILPGIFELCMVGARPAEVDDVLMLRLTPPHLRPGQRSIKRLLDVGGSLCLFLLTAPVLLAAAILVRLSSPGPALFRQTRVGADGKEYTLLKLRTMIVDAERHTGPILAARRDPRITRIGGFLRASRIDELPQLLNVLMGDMSLIGPRPERPHFVRIFRDQLPGYEFRMAVKPGITGLAQIYGRYSTAPELKLRFDLMYIYNYSLAMDIQILFKTILTVFQPSSAEGFAEGFKEAPVAAGIGGEDASPAREAPAVQ